MSSSALVEFPGTSGHGGDEGVQEDPWESVPHILDLVAELLGRLWQRVQCIQLPLHLAPQILYRVHVRAQSGPNHRLNIVLLEDSRCSPGGVGCGVVLLENNTPSNSQKWENNRLKDILDVALCCDATSPSRPQVLEEDRSQKPSPAKSAPDHDRGASPGVTLQDVVVMESMPSLTPHSHPSILVVNRKPAFISEQDVSPLPLAPVQVGCSPVPPRQAVAAGQDGTSVGTSVEEAIVAQ